MIYATYAPTRPATAIPLREWLPWAIFAGLILLLAIYFVGAEQGATSLISGNTVHEFVHDGRHLLGFPCHCRGDRQRHGEEPAGPRHARGPRRRRPRSGVRLDLRRAPGRGRGRPGGPRARGAGRP